jgi:hypothetical protein
LKQRQIKTRENAKRVCLNIAENFIGSILIKIVSIARLAASLAGFASIRPFALPLPHGETDTTIDRRAIGRRSDLLKLTTGLYEAVTVPRNRQQIGI